MGRLRGISAVLFGSAVALAGLQTGSGQDPVNVLVGMDQGSLYKSHHSCDAIANSVEIIFKSKKGEYWPSC